MQDLFSNLENILGKPVDDPMVVRFLEAMGEAHTVVDVNGRRHYVFHEHGFSFEFFAPSRPHIWSIHIFCRTLTDFWKDVPRNKAFVGSLPGSVCCNDDRTSVQSKLTAYPKETYTEKAPAIPPAFPEEQWKAFAGWVRTGEENALPELARPVNDYMEHSEAMPDAIVADVYDAANAEWHFLFLIEDQRLLELWLYSKD